MTNDEANNFLQRYAKSINTEENRNALVAAKEISIFLPSTLIQLNQLAFLNQSSFNALLAAKQDANYVYNGLYILLRLGIIDEYSQNAFLATGEHVKSVYSALQVFSIYVTELDKSDFNAIIKLQKDGLLNDSTVDALVAPIIQKKTEAKNFILLKQQQKEQISMMVLGGFITALGITTVAVGFAVATLGVGGLVIAGVGVVATLVGLGLFACSAYEYSHPLKEPPPEKTWHHLLRY